MKNDMIKFFRIQRQIFGICPNSGEFFRLSDCRISGDEKPSQDWMDTLQLSKKRIDKQEDNLNNKESEMRAVATAEGKKLANKAARKVDKIFTPRKLNPDDCKVIFHPVDYVVFNGDKEREVKNLIFLDRKIKSPKNRVLQNSIKKTVEKENYEWLTLRVNKDGTIDEE